MKDSKLNWVSIAFMIAISKASLVSDFMALWLLLLVLIPYHCWVTYQDDIETQRQKERASMNKNFINRIEEIERNLSTLTLASAFRGKNGTY